MTYTSDDFKPGDLAWGTVHSGDAAALNVLLQRVCDDTWQWKTVGDARGISINHHRERVSDLLPAHVLGPDERAYPKGGVWLDPEDREQARRLIAAYLTEYDSAVVVPQSGEVTSMHAALRALAAEQNAPEVSQPLGDALVRDVDGIAWAFDEPTGQWTAHCLGSLTWEKLRNLRGPVTVYRPEVDQ